jgi:MFS family permease
VGGAIIETSSWQWIFWVNVPVGLALLPLARRGLTESHGPAGRLDLPGVALATAGLLGVVYATVEGNSLGWGSTTVVSSYLAGAALLVAFALWERRAPAPMLPLRFFRSRAFAATSGRLAGDVVRDLRLDLPARPVLPDRLGLRPARGRPAHAALDRHADARRPDRRRAVGQHRLAAR